MQSFRKTREIVDPPPLFFFGEDTANSILDLLSRQFLILGNEPARRKIFICNTIFKNHSLPPFGKPPPFIIDMPPYRKAAPKPIPIVSGITSCSSSRLLATAPPIPKVGSFRKRRGRYLFFKYWRNSLSQKHQIASHTHRLSRKVLYLSYI